MKRKIWVTAGIAAALAFLIAFGAVGCVVSGFDLPLDSYAKVVLICGAASVFCAAAFSLKWGGAAVLCALGRYGAAAIMIGFYCCVPAVLYALSCMERLVRNILKEDVFVTQNVRFLRRIRWCCAAVSGICLPAAFFYPPLIFMTTIMPFLALAVSVVKNVMAAAVEIREENDLTV